MSRSVLSGQPPEPSGEPPSGADLERLLGWSRLAWETSPASVGVTWGPRHLLVFQNEESRRLFGARPMGVPMTEAFPAASSMAIEELDATLAAGQPLVRERRQVGIRDFDGRDVFMRYVVAPYGPAGAQPLGLVISAIDLTGEARAELIGNRSRVLAEASQAMNTAADAHAALQALTDTLVPQLADLAAVYVLPDVQSAQDLAHRGRAPQTMSVAPWLARLGPPPAWTQPRREPAAWHQVLVAGRPVLIPFEDVDPAEVATDPVAREWMVAAGTRNLAAVPLSAAGSLVGVLLLVAAGDRQPYGELILPFLTDLAARAGVAIAQVRQHRVQAQVAQQLQQALLPDAPAPVPGLQIAARYVAGAEDVDVGGDWWDVAPLDDHRMAISVGDACGRGIDAAVLMGQARAAVRTAGLAGLSPSQVLDLADRHVTAYLDGGAGRPATGSQFVTALHAVLDLTAGRLCVANAGHLPLLVHRPEAGCTTVTVPPGAPLGLGAGGYTQVSIDVPPGTSVLLFTDGLVEDRSRDLDTGLASLAEHLQAHAHEEADT
jgi:hypothetical protein